MKNAKCEDCRFLCGEKIFAKQCSDLGIASNSKSCEKFMPNTGKLALAMEENGGNIFELLGEVVGRISSNNLVVLASLIANEKTTRRYGYTLMQKVYVRYRGIAGANYVSNFMPMYVVEASKNGLRLISATGKTVMLKTLFKKGESEGPNIYSVKNFSEYKKELKAAKKLVDPAITTKRIRVAPNIIEDSSNEKETKYVANDLVRIAKDIESGRKVTQTYRKQVSVRRNFDSDDTFTIGK